MQVCSNKAQSDCWQRGAKPGCMTSVSLAIRWLLFRYQCLLYLFGCFCLSQECSPQAHSLGNVVTWSCSMERSWRCGSRSRSLRTRLERDHITGSRLSVLFSDPEMWAWKLLLPSMVMPSLPWGTWFLKTVNQCFHPTSAPVRCLTTTIRNVNNTLRNRAGPRDTLGSTFHILRPTSLPHCD